MKKRILCIIMIIAACIFSACSITYKEETDIYGRFIQSYTIEFTEEECLTLGSKQKISLFFRQHLFYFHSGIVLGVEKNISSGRYGTADKWDFSEIDTGQVGDIIAEWYISANETADGGLKIIDNIIYRSKEDYDSFARKGLETKILADKPIHSRTLFYDITTYEITSPFADVAQIAADEYNDSRGPGFFSRFWHGNQNENLVGFKDAFPDVSIDFGKDIMLNFIKASNTFSDSNGENIKLGNMHTFKWVDLSGVNADLQLQLSVYSARREIWYMFAIIATIIFGGILYIIFKVVPSKTQNNAFNPEKKNEDLMSLYDKSGGAHYIPPPPPPYFGNYAGYNNQGGLYNGNNRDPFAGYNSGNNRDPFAGYNGGNNRDPFAGYNSGNNRDPFAGYNSNSRDPFADYNTKKTDNVKNSGEQKQVLQNQPLNTQTQASIGNDSSSADEKKDSDEPIKKD